MDYLAGSAGCRTCGALYTSVANRDGVECPLVDKLYNSNTH